MIQHTWINQGCKINRNESGMAVARDWEVGKMEYQCLLDTEFQLGKIKIFWGPVGNVCIVLSMYLMSLIYTLKNE